MITTIITSGNNIYRLSNDPEDIADRFIAHKDILFIFPLYFNFSLFYNPKDIIAIPYFMITNVIYHDEYGKALSAYIMYKRGSGPPAMPPPDPPLPVEDYAVLQRNYSLLDEHISKESAIV